MFRLYLFRAIADVSAKNGKSNPEPRVIRSISIILT